MSMRLFLCLVFIGEIVASDSQITSQYETSSKYINLNQRNTRILVTDSLSDSPDDVAQNVNITNDINSITVIPLIKERDKNRTTKKPIINKEGFETQSSQIVNSYPPYAPYEVTENVIDIPDNRRPFGPIVTNYTHRPPVLNLAKPTNKTETDKVTEANKKTKKNSLSILHINAEFDNKEHVVHGNKVDGLFKGIKEYINSFKRGIVNGFHRLFHKHQHDNHDQWDRFDKAIDEEIGLDISDGD